MSHHKLQCLYMILQQPYELTIIILIPILPIGKLRVTAVKWITEGHRSFGTELQF